MGKNEIDLILLSGLLIGPAHGYQIKHRIEEGFGSFYFKLNNSLLYSRLAQFEGEGLIEGKLEIQEGAPNKKVYHLTDAGYKRIRELAATPVKTTGFIWPDSYELTVHAAFFGLITKEEREKVIRPFYEIMKEQYENAIQKYEKYGPEMDKFGVVTVNYGIEMIKQNLELYKKLAEID